jgi:hypothetical protein
MPTPKGSNYFITSGHFSFEVIGNFKLNMFEIESIQLVESMSEWMNG